MAEAAWQSQRTVLSEDHTCASSAELAPSCIHRLGEGRGDQGQAKHRAHTALVRRQVLQNPTEFCGYVSSTMRLSTAAATPVLPKHGEESITKVGAALENKRCPRIS